jgi:hypothetical protein
MPITAEGGVGSDLGAAMSLEEDRAAAHRAVDVSAPGRTAR